MGFRRDSIETAIKADTTRMIQNKKQWCAYIDGKLYISSSGRSFWNRKCDVVNSVKYWSNTAFTVKFILSREVESEHPEWFDNTGEWSRVKSGHYLDVRAAVDRKVNVWFSEHVLYRCIILDN